MENHLLGQTCALLAALSWALAVVYFKRSGEKVSPLPLNLFKNVIGIVLLAATLIVMGDGFGSISGFSAKQIWILVLSGVLGIAVADTLFFYGLNLIGVGLTSIVDCLYSPFIILFSVLMLSEPFGVWQCVGAAVVLSGVFVSSRHKPPPGRTRRQLVAGMLIGASAIAVLAIGIVMFTPIVRAGFPVIWATMLRMVGGTIVVAAVGMTSQQRKQLWSVFRPSSIWWASIPASILGTYVSQILWIAGFKYTYANIAGILNQTSTIFAMILASWMLKERFTKRKAMAAALAVVGVLIVKLTQPS